MKQQYLTEKRQASLRQFFSECEQIQRQYAGDAEKINDMRLAAWQSHKERMAKAEMRCMRCAE